MLREDQQVNLDQLNKDISEFLTLYHWLEENPDAAVLVGRYGLACSRADQALSAVVSEIRASGDMPSDTDPDRQALEQLVIFLKTSLTEEELAVMEHHLLTAGEKIRSRLGEIELGNCNVTTQRHLGALEQELARFQFN